MRWGETTNSALQREVKEETGYAIEILRLLHNYSGPSRDPRISAVCMTYSARCVGGELSASPEGIPTWISHLMRCSVLTSHSTIMMSLEIISHISYLRTAQHFVSQIVIVRVKFKMFVTVEELIIIVLVSIILGMIFGITLLRGFFRGPYT